ncbi:MAG: hypothetical protein WDO13_05400 [Verrucomicrobiota bacterium]
MESPGMMKACQQIQPKVVEDIIALVALYRPGPMEFIPLYADRKAGRVAVEYDHPLLEPILQETYGIMVYQEQVMQAAQVLAGYTLGGADVLRRAMGKKKPEEMAKQRRHLRRGRREEKQHQDREGEPALRRARQVRRLRLQQGPRRLLRPSSPARRRGSRRATRSSSWPRCSPTSSTTPTRSRCSSARPRPWASPCSGPASRQRQRLHRERGRDPLRPLRDQECRQRRGGGDHFRAREGRPLPRPARPLRPRRVPRQ